MCFVLLLLDFFLLVVIFVVLKLSCYMILSVKLNPCESKCSCFTIFSIYYRQHQQAQFSVDLLVFSFYWVELYITALFSGITILSVYHCMPLQTAKTLSTHHMILPKSLSSRISYMLLYFWYISCYKSISSYHHHILT